jgi:protein ImuB
MWWCALRPSTPGTEPAQRALALWAQAYTPRVTLVDEAVLMELAGSARLFGGREGLRRRVQTESHELLGAPDMAWAPNGLAALALARMGGGQADGPSLAETLDVLPLHVLSAIREHMPALEQTGCRTLGTLRQRPRDALGRRFGQALLCALDQLYGEAPEAHEWVTMPEVFDVRLELPSRVEDAPALVFGAHRLLLQLTGWLFARRSGVVAFTLRWAHDAMRSREVGPVDGLTVRTAGPTRDVDHLVRLLAEHLAHARLQAPVGELWLHADEVRPLIECSAPLLPPTPGTARPGEALPLVLERIAARLGRHRVLRPVPVADHRPEAMCRWQPADQPLPGPAVAMPDTPQPGFLLRQPIKLVVRDNRPVYFDELQLLLGPHRVEGGWWDRDDTQERMHLVKRDYWIAFSARAGLLWIFRTRATGEAGPAWYLHGLFA